MNSNGLVALSMQALKMRGDEVLRSYRAKSPCRSVMVNSEADEILINRDMPIEVESHRRKPQYLVGQRSNRNRKRDINKSTGG